MHDPPTPAQRIHAARAAGTVLRTAYAQRPVLGTFLIELPAPATIRALALAGMDFVVLDLEHSPFGTDALPGLVSEAHAAGLPALVRVPAAGEGGAAAIGKVLDLGVAGVLIPQVQSAAQARAVVAAARYAPGGERGVAPVLGNAAAWEIDAQAGDAAVVIVQIEGADAVTSAREIAAVPGLDGVFVGPYDLAQSLGQGRDVDAAPVWDAARRVAADCGPDRILGVFVDDPARSGDWVDAGYRLQCLGFDSRMLLAGARDVLRAAREQA